MSIGSKERLQNNPIKDPLAEQILKPLDGRIFYSRREMARQVKEAINDAFKKGVVLAPGYGTWELINWAWSPQGQLIKESRAEDGLVHSYTISLPQEEIKKDDPQAPGGMGMDY